MELTIPDGARVYIVTGRAPDSLPELRAAPAEGTSNRHPLLKGALAAALLVVAFLAGQHFGGQAGPATAISLPGQSPSPPLHAALPEQHAFPVAPPAHAAASPGQSAKVPPQFAEQLRTPPTVIPPPGQKDALSSNPFGLHE